MLDSQLREATSRYIVRKHAHQRQGESAVLTLSCAPDHPGLDHFLLPTTAQTPHPADSSLSLFPSRSQLQSLSLALEAVAYPLYRF